MIPLFDLTGQYKIIEKEIVSVIKKVLNKGQYILGDEVKNFEKEFAKYLNIKYSVGLASGTDALKIALKSLGLSPEDEVILPANVYPTAFGVREAGVKIKLVDVNLDTYNLDLNLLEKTITEKTKAVIIVHLYGQPADLDSILSIAKKYNLFVIEDCAQAHGAEYKGKKVGTFGDVGCFSFYPTKPLGAYGDGGMIVTNNKRIFEKTLALRMYGEKKRYQSVTFGYNSRIDEIQAAILRIKLKYLNRWNKERRKKAILYKKELKKIREIKVPLEIKHSEGVYHLFVIRAKKRNDLKRYLEKKGIITGIHYPLPIHLVESFRYLGYKNGDFPVSEKLSAEVLSLPLYAEINSEKIKYVTEEIKSFYEEKT
ncbi:MAG: DegT/DnrJ/EryC1/StrS family aminotransferase [Candidatus Omnitrophica bacterium]|nr:DegT/DnrJ/EryC1/StrS family aminotransferase [Candidatus Omnitrophota bacterium]